MADKFIVPIRKGLQTQSRHKGEDVYAYLRENYPADVLKWVKGENWELKRVPLSNIKMARRPGGRNPDKVQRIAEAIKSGEKMEPVVLVQVKGGYKIADGYHRTLAFQHAGKKSIQAWVATGKHSDGPWDAEMHRRKLNKSVFTMNELRKEGDKMRGKSIADPMKDAFYDFVSTLNTESGLLLEAIAADVHDQWVDFAKKVAPEMPEAHAEAWESMYVPYEELSEDEKEKDRVFARQIIGTIIDTMKDRHAPQETVSKALRTNDGHTDQKTIRPALQRAYERAYRDFVSDKDEKPDRPRWSKRAEGIKGEVWRASDGWGEWYFLLRGTKATCIATRMSDVSAYHFNPPLKEFVKEQGITRNTFKDKLGFGDNKWDALMRKFVSGNVKKSIDSGDYRTPSPFATMPGKQSRADDWLESWGADTHASGPQDVYTFYRRVMGTKARDSVSVKATESDTKGTHYRVSDDQTAFNVYVPKNGPLRLLKALTTYTPTSNSVWSILHHAGYEFEPHNGVAEYGGCKVDVRGNRVTVSGRHARYVFQLILAKLREMQTSEDWVGGHQSLGRNDTPAVKPW